MSSEQWHGGLDAHVAHIRPMVAVGEGEDARRALIHAADGVGAPLHGADAVQHAGSGEQLE